MAEDDERQEEQKGISMSQIGTALLTRMQHFKENAEAFTMVRVRRLIEQDLGVEKNSLDVHKKFIKQFLEEHLEHANEKDSTKKVETEKSPEVDKTMKHEAEKLPEEDDTKKNATKKSHLEDKTMKDEVERSPEEDKTMKDGAERSPEEHKAKKVVKGSGAEDEKKLDDSPILGVMDSKSISVDAQDAKTSESSLRKAILERAAHFRANAETMTLASVRRYLEEEIGLEKNALDPFKKFIKNELDEVLSSSDVPTTNEIFAKRTADSSNNESLKVQKGIKSAKKTVPKAKLDKSEGSKKRKSPDRKIDVPTKKQKVMKKPSGNKGSEERDKSDSEDHQSPTSTASRSAKKKVVSAAGYGEPVEKLKSLIKACGMGIPPVVYKKAKQVPEDERQDFLVKELEEILSREGLSTNPSEKDIKEVKKRKERARELEGIDMSNIVSSSRRRSTTTSFLPPPRPTSPIKDIDDKSDDEDSDSNKDDSSDTEEEADGSQIDDLSEAHDVESD
ncbi:unnamed protein product [Cuscuta epithymum]|uniref:DEK-C domain-containing protein n=1 Tax=Cuscuta epithymum TaxID=186058 RepID=A0AAV0FG73_9ASTE|nr:unnamed protein product [Cuscuta epithymum]